ncbi:uncharacterized protein LOC123196553 [Mangifera indica]|uniref:uncharacterized protein LOC123196553 n=1 Tax=Mangifera indica TaxID=29780 RepID=UPI001CFC0751|nr:uncharacterized protein LOC123196553 [Mangifera indica]
MKVNSNVNSVIAKKLWNVLRITFFMIRKGLVSKRKLIMDMNLMMKRGKLLRKSFSNLISLHHHHHDHRHSRHISRHTTSGSYGVQEYEFSCSNSPNPVFSHLSKRKHHYFPCINPPEVFEEEEEGVFEGEPKAVILMPRTPEYTFNFRFDATDLAPGEKRSPVPSPFNVRISNYSSEEENEIAGNDKVDDEAEEFIRRFYEQLRKQSHMQLLQ